MFPLIPWLSASMVRIDIRSGCARDQYMAKNTIWISVDLKPREWRVSFHWHPLLFMPLVMLGNWNLLYLGIDGWFVSSQVISKHYWFHATTNRFKNMFIYRTSNVIFKGYKSQIEKQIPFSNLLWTILPYIFVIPTNI